MDMSNTSIRVAVYIYPPLSLNCCSVALERTPECYPGLACEFLSLCLHALQLSYNITYVSDDLGEASQNGSSCTGALGALQCDVADIIAGAAGLTEKRMEHLSFATPIINMEYVFVIKVRGLSPGDGVRLLVNGFSAYVWYSILGLILTMIVTWAFGKAIITMPDPDNCMIRYCRSVVYTAWDVLSFALQQPQQEHRPSMIFANLHLGLLSVLIVLIVNIYQNIVYNQVSTAAQKPPYQTADELINLIETGHLNLATSSLNLAYFDMVENVDTPLFQSLKRSIKKRPTKVVKDFHQAAQLLLQGGYVYVTGIYAAREVVGKNCELQIVNLGTPVNWAGFYLRNNSLYLAKLNRVIKKIFPLVEHIEKEMLEYYDKRQCVTSKDKPVTLTTYAGLFVIYCGFLAVSVMCFALEYMSKYGNTVCKKNSFDVVEKR